MNKKIIAGALAAITAVSAISMVAFAAPKDEIVTAPTWTGHQLTLAQFVGLENNNYGFAYDSMGTAIGNNHWSVYRRAVLVADDDYSKHWSGDSMSYDYNDLVKPGIKMYFVLNSLWIYGPDGSQISPVDFKDIKLQVKKGEGSKYVKSVKIVDKEIAYADMEHLTDDWMEDLPGTGGYTNPDGTSGFDAHDREYYVEVELKDSYIDKEFAITLNLEVSAKKAIDPENYWYDKYQDDPGAPIAAQFGPGKTIPAGTKIKIESDKFYVNNKILEGDQDFAAGDHGLMVKPIKNDDNTITWEDDRDTLARVTFLGDSDTEKFYTKLSTKWDHDLYDEQFPHTDAYVFDFVASPSFSGVTRVTMELRNPFVDSDDNELVDASEVIIYQIDEDGNFVDVTSDFTYKENADGEMMFISKNRTFGTYIFTADPAVVAMSESEANKPIRVPTGISLPSREK